MSHAAPAYDNLMEELHQVQETVMATRVSTAAWLSVLASLSLSKHLARTSPMSQMSQISILALWRKLVERSHMTQICLLTRWRELTEMSHM